MDDLSSRLAALTAAFTQNARLFSLRFAHDRLDAELLPLALAGDERLSGSYRLVVDCLSGNAHVELKQLLGLGVDIAIHLADGGERLLAGVVTRAEQRGSNGGFARDRLTVEPAFALLTLRRNSRLFQDKSVVQIVTALFDEQIAANPAFAQNFRYRAQLSAQYPLRSFCQQYRESDLTFIERLLREEGISYRFEFEREEGAVGLHTLVLFDAGAALPPAPQQQVRFHRADATETNDTLTEWQASRQLRSGAVQLNSFDYKGVRLQQAGSRSAIDQGETGTALTDSLEDYDPQTLYYAGDDAEQQRYAALRQQAHDLHAKQFSGAGVVRGLSAGQWFVLDEHPAHAEDNESDRQFIVLRQQFVARNNLPGDFDNDTLATAIALPALSEPGFRNRFDAVRNTVPVVPLFADTEHAKPTAHGVQTATVVGPAGEEIFTDELGRIKVQFHWARKQDHDLIIHGASAEKNDFSSCWIRVGYPSAGAGFGQQFIPRVGQEVVVSFLENDIDRPIVSGVIHNGHHAPPTFNGVGSLPANRALSGIKSREYQGSRHNELLFDDTSGEIRAQLGSEHGKSQLSQGFLIDPRRDGKGEPRGEGFELRTDNAGAIRAAQGVLITTEAKPDASGKQLDRNAALQLLDAAVTQADELGTTAKQQQANQPETGNRAQTINADWQSGPSAQSGHLHHLRGAAHNLERKSNTDGDAHSGSGDQPGQQGLLLLNGQQGVTFATPQSAAITTGSNLDHIAQRDTLQTSGRRWISNAAESISLFVAGAGNKLKESFKVIAANGDIQMQAQSGDIEIDGDQSLTITACNESIVARADKALILHCAGAQITLSGGNIEINAPGTLSLKGAQQLATGPTSAGDPLPTFATQSFAGKHRLVRPSDGQPLAEHPYQITMSDGSVVKGVTNANGETSLIQSPSLDAFKIEFFDKPNG